MVSTAQCAKQSMKDWNCKSPRFSLVCYIIPKESMKRDCPELRIVGTARFLPERIYRWLPSNFRPKNHHLIMHQQQQQLRSEMVSLKTEEQQWSLTFQHCVSWTDNKKAAYYDDNSNLGGAWYVFASNVLRLWGDRQQCVHVYESFFGGARIWQIIIFYFSCKHELILLQSQSCLNPNQLKETQHSYNVRETSKSVASFDKIQW